MLTSGAGSSSLALLVVAGSFSLAIFFSVGSCSLTEALLQTEGSSGAVGSFSLADRDSLLGWAHWPFNTNPTPTPRDAKQTSRIGHDPRY